MTNAFSDATSQFVDNVRVFNFAFDDPSTPYFTQDPGFHMVPPSGFAANVPVTVSPVGPLDYWSGSGSPSFGAAAAGTSLRLAFGLTSATVNGSSNTGSVFIGNTDASGIVHEHIESTLMAPAGQNPADGVYLVPLQLTATGYQPSLTFYALYNNGGLADSVIQSAKEYVRDTDAPGSVLAPEPSAVALLGTGAAVLVRRRRR